MNVDYLDVDFQLEGQCKDFIEVGNISPEIP
jgi:hypothetical protein